MLAGAVMLLLPLLAVGKSKAEPAPQLLPASPSPALSPEPTVEVGQTDGAQTVRILTESGSVATMTLAEYLWRVVAAEMPASFEEEALKAQAVCARTYTLWTAGAEKHGAAGADLCDSSACCQAYITHDEAEARWGEMAAAYTARIANAVADTDGFILTYEDEPIQAVFFSSSTASTEDAAAVWGASVPYLVPVDSPEGEEVPNYRSSVTLTAEEVRSLAKTAGLGADLSGKPSGWFSGIRYTASGRVGELTLGGVTLTGGAARSLFGLRSACFTVEEEGGVFTFSVVGYGHGVGMSQYGANAMAAAGSTWREIVSHYYTGVSIEKT